MIFDLICVGIALVFLVFGLMRGLIRQLFGVAGFLGGLVLARIFAAPLAVEFSPALGLSPSLATVAFSIALFICVEVIASLLGSFLHDHLGAITGTLDRVGGGALGLAKGLLFVWAIASFASLMHKHLPAAERNVAPLEKLDLAHSQIIALATDTSFLGDVEQQLKATGDRAAPAVRSIGIKLHQGN